MWLVINSKSNHTRKLLGIRFFFFWCHWCFFLAFFFFDLRILNVDCIDTENAVAKPMQAMILHNIDGYTEHRGPNCIARITWFKIQSIRIYGSCYVPCLCGLLMAIGIRQHNTSRVFGFKESQTARLLRENNRKNTDLWFCREQCHTRQRRNPRSLAIVQIYRTGRERIIICICFATANDSIGVRRVPGAACWVLSHSSGPWETDFPFSLTLLISL